jgi:hypothetical protein
MTHLLPIKKDPAVVRMRHGIPWTASKPFIENSRALLIHRVRYVTTHKIGPRWPVHLAVHAWCGNSMTGTKKFTFLDDPGCEKYVCARCEAAAAKAGLPSSSDLSGRHVHLGRCVAVQACCAGDAP